MAGLREGHQFDAAARRYERAVRRLRAAFTRAGALSIGRAAECVLSGLPRGERHRLRRDLRRRGWLHGAVRLPCDVLDRTALPAALGGATRELARLALFGLPGQGRMSDQKQREMLFQRLSAEIMREGFDLARLERVGQRVLYSREVAADGVLAGMLRSVVAQRESELRAAQRESAAAAEADSEPAQFQAARAAAAEFMTREQVHGMLQRLALKFDDHVAHFEELAAQQVMEQIELLARRYPVHADQRLLDHCRRAKTAFDTRIRKWREAIEVLADRGAVAAVAGDEKTAKWVIRRLHAIHALRGALLSEAHLQELIAKIRSAESHYEEREAADALLKREREIVAEVRGLADAIRRFHAVAREYPPDSAPFRVAADRYRAAIAEVKRHDQEWLTSVFIELEELVDELHDTTGKAENQINHFIENVRTALLRMRQEIRDIHAERLDQPLLRPPPAAGGAAPT